MTRRRNGHRKAWTPAKRREQSRLTSERMRSSQRVKLGQIKVRRYRRGRPMLASMNAGRRAMFELRRRGLRRADRPHLYARLRNQYMREYS